MTEVFHPFNENPTTISVQISLGEATITVVSNNVNDVIDVLRHSTAAQLYGHTATVVRDAKAQGLIVGTLGARPIAAPVETRESVPTPSEPEQDAAPTTSKAPTAPQCVHDGKAYDKVFRQGTSKNGKKWSAWFCNFPDRNAQCDPQWV